MLNSLYMCYTSSSIEEVMKILNENAVGLVYVLDDNDCLAGCISDGDIRRWILKGGDLKSLVSDAMNAKPVYVYESESNESRKKMLDSKVYSVAIVDNTMRVKDVVFLDSHMKIKAKKKRDALKDVPVIIMAGGEGTRLYPYTKILPKPLIPIGDVPILERILNRFNEYGAEEFYLTVNYKREMIKSYFSEHEYPYNIRYIEETEPLGTAGSISLIEEKFTTPIVVSNCDIIIIADYYNILMQHLNSGNEMTIVSSVKNTTIPYGVLHLDEDGSIASMEEKPVVSHLVNTGMYIINPECLDLIPKKRLYHMTDLAEQMISRGMKVGVYPISEEFFLDMGQFEEMKKMEERIAELESE